MQNLVSFAQFKKHYKISHMLIKDDIKYFKTYNFKTKPNLTVVS